MIWAKTSSGRNMPLNFEPHANGTFVVEFVGERVLCYKAAAHEPGDKYVPHHATCPDAERWRKSVAGE